MAHDPDLEPLRAALRRAGVAADVVCWDDESVDWGRFDAALLRSTWDYADRLVEFRAWLGVVVERTRLVNPIDVVEWNIDKHYLAALAVDGVPVVPTVFVEVGDDVPLLDPDVDVFVVKPAIGAGSKGARRCLPDEVAEHVSLLHAAGVAVMVQPYLDQIDEHAETSLVYLGRGGGAGAAVSSGSDMEFDHAFSKGAILRSTDVDEVGGLFAAEEIGPRIATPAERALAERVLRSSPVAALGPLAYARVDVVPTSSGPVLLELELIEPSLYFDVADGAADRAAAAWVEYLDAAGDGGRLV